MSTEESAEKMLQGKDANRGVRKLAAIGNGAARGISSDEALAGLRELAPDVCLAFDPEEQLQTAYLSWTGDAYAVQNREVPEDWDADALTRTEAGALLDGGFRIRPVAASEAGA